MFSKWSVNYDDGLWVLPKRVLIPFIDPIKFCDYIFPNESTEECIERCNAMLSISTDIQDLTLLEEYPVVQPQKTVSKVPKSNSVSTPISKEHTVTTPSKGSTSTVPLLVVLSFLILIIAVYITILQ